MSQKNRCRTWRFLLFFHCAFILSLLPFQGMPQQIITIGTDTTTNVASQYPAPYGNMYWGAKHHFLIRAAEITALGGASGDIIGVAFDVAVPAGTPLNAFNIRIKISGPPNLNNNFNNGGFQQVFGPQSYTDVAGWNTHTFSSPFFWDGTSNIVIETCFNNSSFTTNARHYNTATNFNSTLVTFQDVANVCGTPNGQTMQRRPNLRLLFDQPNINIPNFYASSTFSCSGTVSFTDSSCCNITGWQWDFGDGNFSTQQNPVHTYTSSGTYSVKLVTTNAAGSDSITRQNYVTVYSGTGPSAPSCAPGTRAYCCGFGIRNVTFNGINVSSADGISGYQDFSCMTDTVFNGRNYLLSVSTPSPSGHNVRAWIDFDNNGVFNNANELVLSANGTYLASGNVYIPTSAVTNLPLRMRVSADYELNPAPGPCDSVQFGQVEDYSVYILQNTNPPEAAFSSDVTTTCTGTVLFSDQSQNLPTSWLWDFGDGNTSVQQNPSHTYSANGLYTVTLTAYNTFGSDMTVSVNYIDVQVGNVPVTPACQPLTVSYCCNYGITFFSLNTIYNTSADGSAGYSDFTCAHRTTLSEGQIYAVNMTTHPTNGQDTKIWIDLNNDGAFDPAGELIFSALNTINPSGNISISSGAVLNTPLRMRVSSDFAGSNPGPCSQMIYGQTEDYTVTIVSNTLPPAANFSASPLITCDGLVNFSDQSLNIPLTWLWNFGDGNTSNLQNPSHTYTTTGNKTIKLVVTNSFGADSLTRVNYVNIVSVSGAPVAASCSPATSNWCCGYGITNVTFNTINSNSTNGSVGYQDFSCTRQTTIMAGQQYPVSVSTSIDYVENVGVWIDYNNNGNMNDSGEYVFKSSALLNHAGNILIPATAVLNQPLRMRVMSDENPNPLLSPCQAPFRGQAEDYTVIITPNTLAPQANFKGSPLLTCSGKVNFTDLSLHIPSSWLWKFGDGVTSTSQNPSHQYTSSGLRTVQLFATNAFGTDSMSRTSYISVQLGSSVCDTSLVNIPPTGTGPLQTTCNGILYDSGGPLANYNNNSTGSISIAPTGAARVILTFTEFAFQPGVDFLEIYDGPNIASPIIGRYTGFALPNGGTIVSSGRYITLREQTDGMNNQAGFKAMWTCEPSGIHELGNQAMILFPNPSKDKVNIKFTSASSQGWIIKVMNILGTEIHNISGQSKGVEEMTLDFSGYSNGIYIVILNDGISITSKKLIIE